MSSYKTRKTPGDTIWFTHDRFGMFIHFGLYSMPGRHEWVKSREKISEEKYDVYFKNFNPDRYDPKEWARLAKSAGMKYAVMTAKHHEGFCMFDSQYTDYKSTNTPASRDLIKEYVDAFRGEGLKAGLYYSLLDWHHPDYTLDCHHPRRDDDNSENLNEGRDMRRYAQYMRNQVTELLTNYGKIDIIWFDYSFLDGPERPTWKKGKGKIDWESEELIRLIRKLQPHIIINNRTEIEQDLWTPEQYQPQEWLKHSETGELVTWEACQTLSGSWGYNRDEMTWKSPEMLIQMLISTVSEGGNLLMNVGPTSRGYLDCRAVNALKTYEEWMKYNCRSIYGCTKAEPEFSAPNGCKLTQREDGKRLYIHLFHYPFKSLNVPGLTGKVSYAQFLHDGSEILFNTDGESNSSFMLPPVKPSAIVPVIEVFLD